MVNDTFGHLAGDAYLKFTASVIKQVVKRKTDIVARFGGEEFVVIIPDDSIANALILAEKIRKILDEKSLRFDGNIIQTTLSLGVAEMFLMNQWQSA